MTSGVVARAAVLEEFGQPFEVREVEFFAPGPGRLLVRTGATPFCVTDILNARGQLGKNPPTILGHSSMGIVEAVGEGAGDFAVGDRVVVPGTPECGRCFYCRRGLPAQCSELFDLGGVFPKVGLLDGVPVEGAGNVAGYAEVMNVSRNQVWKAPDLPDEIVSMFGCGILTGLGAALNVADIQRGDVVAVVGTGQLGLWALQGARLAGARSIIAVDPDEHRRAIARGLGADDAVGPDEALDAARSRSDGRGADVVIEAAGPVAAQSLAVGMARRGGTIVLMGLTKLGSEVSLSQVAIGGQGRRLLGCQNGNVVMGRDIPRFAGLIASGAVTAEPFLTSGRYSLEGLNDALERSEHHEDLCGIVIPGR